MHRRKDQIPEAGLIYLRQPETLRFLANESFDAFPRHLDF
jgi:hypothetical protein